MIFEFEDDGLEYTDILYEYKRTAYRAIKIGGDGKSDKVVYFATQANMDKAIASGSHRHLNPTKDVAAIEKDNAKAEKERQGGTPKPTTGKKDKTTSAKAKTGKEPPKTEKERGEELVSTIAAKVPVETRVALRKSAKITKNFWNTKLKPVLDATPNYHPNLKETQTHAIALMEQLMSAETFEEKYDAASKLIKSRYVGFDKDDRTKMYMETKTTGIDQDFLTRKRGKLIKQISEFTRDVADIMEASGQFTTETDRPPMYGKSDLSRKSHLQGLQHEYGIAYFIEQFAKSETPMSPEFDSETDEQFENRHEKNYRNLSYQYAQENGNANLTHYSNERTAHEIIENFVPEGAKVIGVTVERDSKNSDKLDPTDITIQYNLNGNAGFAKISLKHQNNSRQITLRSLSMKQGSTSVPTLFGEDLGTELSELYSDLEMEMNTPEDAPTTTEEQIEQKVVRKVRFTTALAEKLSALEKSEGGQERLRDMWKKMHGCDKNVYMVITNYTTSESDTRGPNSYCAPEKLSISYSSKRITVRMLENPNSYMEFNFRERSQKQSKKDSKPQKYGELQVLRKFKKDKTVVPF